MPRHVFLVNGEDMPLFLVTQDASSSELVAQVQSLAASTSVSIQSLPEKEVAWLLKDNDCDLALVSPIVYAQNQSEFSVLGGAAVSAFGPSSDAVVCFNEGLHHFDRVACPDDQAIEATLAGIIFREKYDMYPSMHVFPGSIPEALERFDAVVVPSSTQRQEPVPTDRVIDLVDEWWDLTELPFVRYIVAGWTHRITPPLSDLIEHAGAAADAESLRKLAGRMDGRVSPDERHFIPGHHRFHFDQDIEEGLSTFFRYAFYHGLHRDVPQINLWRPEQRE